MTWFWAFQAVLAVATLCLAALSLSLGRHWMTVGLLGCAMVMIASVVTRTTS